MMIGCLLALIWPAFACPAASLPSVRAWMDTTARSVFLHSGETSLMQAVRFGSNEMTLYLLEHGEDVNARAKNPERETALMRACEELQVEKVRLLLEAEARPDDTNAKGLAALHLVLMTTRESLAATRMPPEEKTRRKVQIVYLLLEFGADVDLPAPGGQTALMQAAANGQDQVVETLLGWGANTRLRGPKGLTAAQFARNEGYNGLAAMLDRYGTFRGIRP